MKTKLILVITLISSFAFAHQGVELGPNGGRILEFSKNETMHGEVTVKGDQFHIALLDKDMKQVTLAEQTLTATGGTREQPVKIAVTRTEKGFSLPTIKPGEWLILQFRDTPTAKAITARFNYNTSVCAECSSQEWVCKCPSAKE
ncbi:MAG: hypothetical protein JNJ83_15480 [Verrucomicrobiaceae bacterium]|nr:hypothetical protein [Verrucomicrobiaceae bacterium]